MFGRQPRRGAAGSDGLVYVFGTLFFLAAMVFLFVPEARAWGIHAIGSGVRSAGEVLRGLGVRF